jgi:hypothetical protein
MNAKTKTKREPKTGRDASVKTREGDRRSDRDKERGKGRKGRKGIEREAQPS